MKKIMFYINAIHDGGAERVMINLTKYFSEVGYDTILVTSFRDKWEYTVPEHVKRLSLENAEIKQARWKRNLSRICKLRKLCKKEKPDLLISFMAEPNVRALIATIGLPVKNLVSVRNDPEKEYGGTIGHLVGKLLLPLADGCVFQTEEAKKWFPQKLQRKSQIIYNSVKEDFYHVQRKPHKREIVTCGRLEKQKNHALLIQAFANVVKKYPDAILKIYGEGSLKEMLQNKINELDLQGKAFLMGATNHVEKILETADLFVLSSDFEGMPNALMEAMAAGVPCIATDCPCGGPRELFGRSLSKQLVDVDNVESMTNCIEKTICKENTINIRIIENQLKNRANHFSPDRVNESWESYINKLTTERSQ